MIMVKKLIGVLAATFGVLTMVTTVDAAVLKNAFLQLSNATFGASSVTHTYNFYHVGSDLGSVEFEYCTTASGSCADPSIDVDDPAAISSITESSGSVSTDWTLNISGTNVIQVTRGANDEDDTADNDWVFAFNTISHPAYDSTACSASSNTSTKTCYVRVTTYSDTNYTTAADATILSMTLTRSVSVTATVDPSFTLVISGIRPSQTATINGTTLTSAITSTITTIPFGNLTPGTAKYVGQSATVTTNADGGYSITARMSANMSGTAYGDDIDQYTHTGGTATTTQSQSWTSPDGTESGEDSGWLGVGTDDGDVTNAASNQFFSLGTTATTVARQTSSVQNEIDSFVYAIQVNSYQKADSYSGTLRYNALPVY